tara:strand:+ start:5995 stop:8184 length:2190 start_codon:yes stop_codon:yes gene_type:complete
MRFFFLITSIFFSSQAQSTCNFQTGEFTEEMSDPSQILRIEIDIPKSSKYATNAIKTITSKSTNIPPKLKKNFKANILVHYKFGVCEHSAKVRQNGDLKDHLMFKNGNLIRSLDVKLFDGNILNAVKFKLLIPKTRNGYNEILGTSILKNLGFITPETFEVVTVINKVAARMIFQEKASKELLERNKRREGPIFKGDESLIWSYKSFQNSELAPLSLSNLVNHGWFKKGDNSKRITLNSYALLQIAHLKARYNKIDRLRDFHIFPNRMKSNLYTDLYNILYSMNGVHALSPNNRKHYFNTIESRFEPIYYDGDLSLVRPVLYDNQDYFPSKEISPQLLEKITLLDNDDKLYKHFKKRVIDRIEARKYFTTALAQFKTNIRLVNNKSFPDLHKKKYFDEARKSIDSIWYKRFQEKKGVKQKIVTEVILNKNKHTINFDNGESFIISNKELSKVLTKNTLNGKRTTFIPSKKHYEYKSITNIKKFNIDDNYIHASNGMKVTINKNKKILRFEQTYYSDWALIHGGDYSGWEIDFKGKPFLMNKLDTSQERINIHGLTGCLTIYKSVIDNTSISATGGGCEDSINFVDTIGKGLVLFIKDARSDAIDADFSYLSFRKIQVNNAGNDCLDVSAGEYSIDFSLMEGCIDKAISIGEKSEFFAKKIIVRNSSIAVSVKDSSKANILDIDMNDVDLCTEVKRKKQEFGGAALSVDNYSCSSSVFIDSESIFLNDQS